MSEGIHTCHAECPCHMGGKPVPDFASLDTLDQAVAAMTSLEQRKRHGSGLTPFGRYFFGGGCVAMWVSAGMSIGLSTAGVIRVGALVAVALGLIWDRDA